MDSGTSLLAAPSADVKAIAAKVGAKQLAPIPPLSREYVIDCNADAPDTQLLRAHFRGRHGGVEKRGGRKTSQMTPLPKRGFGRPSYGTFSTLLACRCSAFPVQKSTIEQTRRSFGGV